MCVQCVGGFVYGHELGYSLPCVMCTCTHMCVYVSVSAHAHAGAK